MPITQDGYETDKAVLVATETTLANVGLRFKNKTKEYIPGNTLEAAPDSWDEDFTKIYLAKTPDAIDVTLQKQLTALHAFYDAETQFVKKYNVNGKAIRSDGTEINWSGEKIISAARFLAQKSLLESKIQELQKKLEIAKPFATSGI